MNWHPCKFAGQILVQMYGPVVSLSTDMFSQTTWLPCFPLRYAEIAKGVEYSDIFDGKGQLLFRGRKVRFALNFLPSFILISNIIAYLISHGNPIRLDIILAEIMTMSKGCNRASLV